jgi:tripartite-type tricarboxylate transporter receptor subunit TctC
MIGHVRTWSWIAAAACLAATFGAAAQAYPAKPIRVVVTQPPGGIGTDMVIRLMAPKMSEALGQPVVVDNRGGASGVIGAEIVAHAAPDGYTLMFSTPTQVITVLFLSKSVPYDPLKDFTPITVAAEPVTCLVVNAAVSANSVRELIDYAKRNPGKLSYGTPGIGSVYHLTGETFNAAAGVNLIHVPYKGPMQALNDLFGGRIEVSYTSLGTALPFQRAGKLKVLAILEGARYSGTPELATVGESVPGFEKPASWFALFGPAGLPQPLVARLHAEAVKALHAPDVRAKLDEGAIAIVANTPEQFAAMLKRGREVYGAAAKAANLKPE